MTEQRNPYTGAVPRPFLRFTLSDPVGDIHELPLLADSGSPYPFILKPDWFDRLVHTRTHFIDTNFGRMHIGWLHLYMPEFGLVEMVKGYSSPKLDEYLRDERSTLVGLVGLPILRLGEYGGNASEFWFRHPPTPPGPP